MPYATKVWLHGDPVPTEAWHDRFQQPRDAAKTFAKDRWARLGGKPGDVQSVNVWDDYGTSYVFEVTATEQIVFSVIERASAWRR